MLLVKKKKKVKEKISVLIDYTQLRKDCYLSLNGPYGNNEKQNLLSMFYMPGSMLRA